MSAMAFNLSETMIPLAWAFSRLIAKNDRSQVDVATGVVPRFLKETLMLLNTLDGMRFSVLDVLSGGTIFIFLPICVP